MTELVSAPATAAEMSSAPSAASRSTVIRTAPCVPLVPCMLVVPRLRACAPERTRRAGTHKASAWSVGQVARAARATIGRGWTDDLLHARDEASQDPRGHAEIGDRHALVDRVGQLDA